MHRCTTMDLKDIKHIVHDDAKMLRLKMYLSLPKELASIYVNADKTALTYYFRINESCLEVHVESLPEVRGKALKDFCISSGVDVVSSDDKIQSVIALVEESNRALLLFMGTLCKRQGKINTKIIFSIERKDYIGD